MHGEIVEMGKVSIYVKYLQSLMMRLLRKSLWFLLYQIHPILLMMILRTKRPTFRDLLPLTGFAALTAYPSLPQGHTIPTRQGPDHTIPPRQAPGQPMPPGEKEKQTPTHPMPPTVSLS